MRAMPDATPAKPSAKAPVQSKKKESNLFASDSDDEEDLFSSKPAPSGENCNYVSDIQVCVCGVNFSLYHELGKLFEFYPKNFRVEENYPWLQNTLPIIYTQNSQILVEILLTLHALPPKSFNFTPFVAIYPSSLITSLYDDNINY